MKTDNRPEHSAFEGETIGEVIPDDWVMIKNPDGTIKFVAPEKVKTNGRKGE